MKLTHALSILVLSLSSVAVAQQQDGTFPPQGPGGRGEGQEGERPRQPIDPAQLVERLMQGDANGDGKLSKDELPPQLAERMMERADTNMDGLLDRAELEAAAKSGAMAGGRGGARGGAGGGAPVMNLEGAMKQINRSYRALKSSGFDAASRKSDLDNIQSLQGAIVAAKAGGANMRMSDAAKKKFGDDRAKFETEFRTMLLETLVNSIEIEKAVLAGKGADAKGLVAKLHDMEEKGHDLFQPGEGDERGEGAPPQPGQAGQPPRGGRGRPTGNPPAGGAPGAGT
jgi:hypothetical protein